ncbi:MAG: phosphorylase family protein [Pseudonocardiales bacterium]
MPKPVLYTVQPVLYAPLRVEHAALRGATRSMRLVRTGMGPRRAAAAALSVARTDVAHTDATRTDRAPVLVAGVGGGLAPQVRPGDVVVASEVWGDGPGGVATGRRVDVPSAPLLADALRLLGLTVHVGPIVSSPRILRGTARTRAAAAEGGPLAVDMESAALVPAGATSDAGASGATGAIADATRGVPFAVVRVIVDSVDHPLWSVGTLLRGVRALRVLRACLPALEWWAAAMAATDRRSTIHNLFKITNRPASLTPYSILKRSCSTTEEEVI